MKQVPGEISVGLLEGVTGVTVDDPWCVPNVKILGMTSVNTSIGVNTPAGVVHGRRYSESCLRDAVPLYEGLAVYNNHNSADSEYRNPKDVLGYLKNVKFVPGDGLRGDLHFTNRGELAEAVKVASREKPSLYGLSHDVPRGGSRSHIDPDGWQVVDEILKVNSADLVVTPATSRGLHEGVPIVADPVQKKCRDIILPLASTQAEKARFERILESIGDMGDMAVGQPPVTEEAKPEDTIKATFKGMMAQFLDQWGVDQDDSALLDNIKNAAKAAGIMVKGGEPKAEEPKKESSEEKKPEPEAKGDEAKKESVERIGSEGAAALLEAKSITITTSLLRTLSTQTKEQAEAILESVTAKDNEIADLKKRLDLIKPEEATRSSARPGALLEAVKEKEAEGEYKPMFLPSVN